MLPEPFTQEDIIILDNDLITVASTWIAAVKGSIEIHEQSIITVAGTKKGRGEVIINETKTLRVSAITEAKALEGGVKDQECYKW